MNLKKILIFIILLFSFLFIDNSFAAINMSISPIKYEINAHTGAIITKQAKLTNNSNTTFHIITGKSDFIANGDDGKPRFIRRSEEVFEQNVSDWITIDTPEFDIAPGETKIIHFTINIPNNATPGGHYGAIFFKNKNSEQSNGASIGINVDYGILILINIEGEIINNINIETPIIEVSHHNGGNTHGVTHMDVCNETGGDFSGDYYDGKCGTGKLDNSKIEKTKDTNKNTNIDKKNNTSNKQENKKESNKDNINIPKNNNSNKDILNLKKDDCIVDLTNSEYDGKCIDDFDKIINEITGNIDEIDFEKDLGEDKDNDFITNIIVPIENKGNTHVKPKGKITLVDENGKVIKGVGKEVITNDRGAIIGEKIVDYVPFNDIGGNVLPNTKRNYKTYWKGFPYKTYDEEGNLVVKYYNPGEYYTKQSLEKKKFLMPWERICTKYEDKKITAKFNIKYPGENGEEVEFNSAKDFNIKYKKQIIGLNPYFFIALFILLLIIYLLFLIFGKKKKRCINKKCRKKIDKDMKVCPYCGTKQKEKKDKKKKKKTKIKKV